MSLVVIFRHVCGTFFEGGLPIFAIQVISAFFAGGFIIALLSFFAEKSPRSLRGIIISFPSTMAVSFVFLALSLGPDQLLPVLPAVYYSLLGAILFAFSFTFVAQRFSEKNPNKKWRVPCTLILASCAWFMVSLLSSKLPQIHWVALPCLLIGITLLQPLFTIYVNHFPDCASPPQITFTELLFRGIFAGTVVAAAVVLARALGPFWGAVVGGTYPASFGSQLMLFQLKYPSKFLPSLIKTVPVGILSTTVYSTIVCLTYPRIGILLGTLVAFAGSLCTSLLVVRLSRERNER